MSFSKNARLIHTEVIAMQHLPSSLARATALLSIAVACTVMACTKEQREDVGSATDSAAQTARAMLSVVDIDMGRHVDAEQKISDKTDEFAPTDTIYASVHTSGTANNNAVVGRWTFEDGTVADEKTHNVTTSGDARTVFSLLKPEGLKKGKYTLHVLIDGSEVRTKDVTVK
jgi:hypothetical protein